MIKLVYVFLHWKSIVSIVHSNATPKNKGGEKKSSINNATQQNVGNLARQLPVAKEGPEGEML
jgi:hypothetical protein